MIGRSLDAERQKTRELRERLSSLERLIREVSRFVEDPERVR